MNHGFSVAAFERAFAEYVGAKYAIALVNGTATLHTALVALGVQPGDRVAVPPLTMSATTLAVLQAGAVPVFCDVDPATWLMERPPADLICPAIPVSLYGLHAGLYGRCTINDAAQTLALHQDDHDFTSYSFQASKILALGEGGMLVTNDEALATRAREFSSLGYRMRADQPRIDPAVLKSPTYERHHWPLAFNYRMNDLTAAEGLQKLARIYAERDFITREALPDTRYVDLALQERAKCAALYRSAIAGCDWLTPQHVPEGWTHDYWAYAVVMRASSIQHPREWPVFTDTIVRHGGERPYGAWRLTYQEPAFRHLAPDGTCPIAEDLQPRLLQFQTNNMVSAERNAEALRRAIREIGG